VTGENTGKPAVICAKESYKEKNVRGR
jgi:hypothetical protein